LQRKIYFRYQNIVSIKLKRPNSKVQ